MPGSPTVRTGSTWRTSRQGQRGQPAGRGRKRRSSGRPPPAGGHVLPGHDGEVASPESRKSSTTRRLGAVVAQDEAEEQAAVDRVHGPRAAVQQLVHPVGGVGDSVAPSPTSSSRVGSRTATMWRLRHQGRRRRPAARDGPRPPAARRRAAAGAGGAEPSRRRPAAPGGTDPPPRRPPLPAAEWGPGVGPQRHDTGERTRLARVPRPPTARAARVQERTKHPATTSTACPRRTATSTGRRRPRSAAPGQGVGTASHAPAAVARAAAATAPSPSPRAGDAVRPHRTPSIGPWPDRA